MTALETLSHVLSSLREIDGTLGSFVVSANGRLLASDTAFTMSEGTLLALAQRVPSLYRGLNTEPNGALERIAIRYSDRQLHVQSLERGFLCVLTAAAGTTPLFGMALSVAARRLSFTLDQPGAAL